MSGAVGGNVAGSLMKKFSMGTLGNSLVGILGGGIGGQLLGLLGVSTGAGGLDIGSILSTVAAGGVGGGVLMAAIGMVKSALGKN